MGNTSTYKDKMNELETEIAKLEDEIVINMYIEKPLEDILLITP